MHKLKKGWKKKKKKVVNREKKKEKDLNRLTNLKIFNLFPTMRKPKGE